MSVNALAAHLAHGDLAGPCCESSDILCDDDNACTDNACTIDECVEGVEECVAPELNQPTDCSDGIECTVNSCDPSVGCVSDPDDSLCGLGFVCDPTADCVPAYVTDTDGDGVSDDVDNCQFVFNSGQEDNGLSADGFDANNGVGNACDCPCWTTATLNATTPPSDFILPSCDDNLEQTLIVDFPSIIIRTDLGGGSPGRVYIDIVAPTVDRAVPYLDPPGADLPRHQECRERLLASNAWQDLCVP